MLSNLAFMLTAQVRVVRVFPAVLLWYAGLMMAEVRSFVVFLDVYCVKALFIFVALYPSGFIVEHKFGTQR